MPVIGTHRRSAKPPEIDPVADAPEIIDHPSPNFGPRRDGLRPEFIVLHYTAMDTAAAALDRLCDPGPEVSAHYLICEQGRIYQLVAEDQRAWHAGAGRWQNKEDLNSRSIGIELANRGDHPFAHAQMAALDALLPEIMARWDIPAAGVIGHSDMAPGRKIDPGPKFDWRRLACQGLSIWPDDTPEPEMPLGHWKDYACVLGYDVFLGFSETEFPEDTAFSAFRARFRPWTGAGDIEQEDIRVAKRLVYDAQSD